MPWFGPPWNGYFCAAEARSTAPVGDPCVYCREPIETDDSGSFVFPADLQGKVAVRAQPMHLPCLVRVLVGGINHQDRKCRCCGGSAPADPPSLTLREAARVAHKHFALGMRRRCTAVSPPP